MGFWAGNLPSLIPSVLIWTVGVRVTKLLSMKLLWEEVMLL